VTTKDRNHVIDGVPDGVFGTPDLADFNGDGFLEVSSAASMRDLYVLNHVGNHLPAWPRHLGDSTWSSPAVADLDQDGDLEVIVGAYYHDPPCPDRSCGIPFAFRPDGSHLPGWPRVLDFHIDFTPAVGDIDRDGELEIVIGTGQANNASRTDRARRVCAFEARQTAAGLTRSTAAHVCSSACLADRDGNGSPVVLVGDCDGNPYECHQDEPCGCLTGQDGSRPLTVLTEPVRHSTGTTHSR
jgi:hypothetical protein